MAILTTVIRSDVVRALRRQRAGTDRHRSVMAGKAGTAHDTMVKGHSRPRRGCVAGCAVRARIEGHVVGREACGVGAVVAAVAAGGADV